jgi:hypothetical protein
MTMNFKPFYQIFYLLPLAFAFFVSQGDAFAQQEKADENAKKESTLLGHPLTPLSIERYLVLKDVTLRGAPTTKGKRLGLLNKGDEVVALGQAAKGDWIAVKKGEEELGFVYAPMVVPLINGFLGADIKGQFLAEGSANCEYVIRYAGRNVISGEAFHMLDYDVSFRCQRKGRVFDFPAHMFMTDVDYQLSKKGVHQITIDILGVGDRFDEPFSTTSMFKRKKGRVEFDNVFPKKFRKKPKIKQIPAKTLQTALVSAVRIAMGAWNDKAWGEITRRTP